MKNEHIKMLSMFVLFFVYVTRIQSDIHCTPFCGTSAATAALATATARASPGSRNDLNKRSPSRSHAVSSACPAERDVGESAAAAGAERDVG